MKVTRFRVENFRNIEDSGWIPVDDVTALVGCNEAGKTALLKALHLFNPATSERLNPKHDYPRDRYAHDWPSPTDEMDWPVCHVEFTINDDLQSKISSLLPADEHPPTRVIVTRNYDHSLHYQYDPRLREDVIGSGPVSAALRSLAASARQYREPHRDLEKWANDKLSQLKHDDENMHTAHQVPIKGGGRLSGRLLGRKRRTVPLSHTVKKPALIDVIRVLHDEVETYADDKTADAIERFRGKIDELIDRNDARDQVVNLIEQEMPTFIYFENYGVLDSGVRLSRFVEDLDRDPHDPRIRTLNAIFKHAKLDPRLIADPDDQQDTKEERAIRLNSASIEISTKFSNWWKQRRHKITYHADGDYFRIYVADDRRPDVRIELEARSKGFQWFFSFYLVFLVESDDQHRNAILLLDEPGLHLHPTAQKELIDFFDELAKSNQLIYTTHSPFLIDGNNLHRIRLVFEKENGSATVSVNNWPTDRKTLFPVEAAAGYAIMKGLFKYQKNLLVEGITDYHYLHALSHECAKLGRHALPDGIVVTPCEGTKHIGRIASLFIGHKARPVILLDDDEAGRIRHQALLEKLFSDNTGDVLLLGKVIGINDRDVEMEDVIGEELILRSLREALGVVIEIAEEDRREEDSPKKRSLIQTIKATAQRNSIDLPSDWKFSVATWIVSALARGDVTIDDSAADRADRLLKTIGDRLGKTS